MPTRPTAIGLVALVSVCLTGCGGGPTGTAYQNTSPTGQQPPGQQPPSGSATITVKAGAFDPSTTLVNAGTTVTWTWEGCRDDGYGGGATCLDHSVTFTDGPTSPTQSSGTYSRQFNAAGTFSYHCRVHASMTGQVTVR